MPPILAQQAFLKATATSFFFFASLNCFVLLPLHVQHLGGTEVAVGIVMAVFLIGNSGGAFLFGGVAHRFGYGVTWSTLTAILLVGAFLSLGLHDDRASRDPRA